MKINSLALNAIKAELYENYEFTSISFKNLINGNTKKEHSGFIISNVSDNKVIFVEFIEDQAFLYETIVKVSLIKINNTSFTYIKSNDELILRNISDIKQYIIKNINNFINAEKKNKEKEDITLDWLATFSV